jgi:hypothetical protein
MGVEWRPIGLISLRAGYKTDTTKELSAMAGITAGVGLSLWGQEFSYAWLPYGDLGTAQYFSLVLKWGAENEGKRNLIQYQTIKRHQTATNRSDADPLSDPQIMQLLGGDAEKHVDASQVLQ